MIGPILLASSNALEHVAPHTLFRVGSLTINNHLFMAGVASVLMLAVFLVVFRSPQIVPSGVQNFFEAICVYFRDEVARPVLHEHTDRFMPFIWTMFFFILFSNLLGMIPLGSLLYLTIGLPLGLAGLKEFYGTPTANIYVTGALAAFTFVMIHVSGILNNIAHRRAAGSPLLSAAIVGFFLYWYKMVPHIGGVLGVVLFVPLFFLEFFGLFVKSVALAIRLFANMVAGHIVLAMLLLFVTMVSSMLGRVLVGSVSAVGAVAISCLELFVAFLQAYIFTFLATLFIGMAVHQEH